MTSHEQFLKDVEADIARLNAALQEEDMEDDDCILTSQDQDIGQEEVTSTDPDLPTSQTTSTSSNTVKIENCNSNTTSQSSVAVPGQGEDLLIEDIDMPDLDSMLKDHEALLLQIDSVLQRKDVEDGEASGAASEYDQFSAQPSPAVMFENPVEEEEEEEEDYFKGMNEFVASDTVVDVEILYDVLQTNLQYQDFLMKLNAEVEKRLQKNLDKQKELGDEEDHMFLVSRGYVDHHGSRTPNTKIISLQRFRPPYFSNYYRIGPRMNEDQIRLSDNHRYQIYLHESAWGKVDRNHLVDCLKNTVIDEKMSQLMLTDQKDDADLYYEKLQSTPDNELLSQSDIEHWSELQWQEVVMSLGSVSCSRSRSDCHNQWNNYMSPKVKKTEWSGKEDALLENLVGMHGMNSWQLIASKMNSGRKAWQCLQRYQKIQKKPTTQWYVADDKQLMDAVMIYGDASFADLSYYMGDKSSDQCLQRWRYSIRPQIKRGKWTEEEDAKIMAIITEYGFDWQKIKDVQKHRTRAQVRERVRILTAKNKLGTNGGTKYWSVHESFELMRLIKKHGPKNWANIRRDLQLRYTAPVLFRRWVRMQTLLNGTCKRIQLPWERTFMNELLKPKRFLTSALQQELADMLPSPEEKLKIGDILEKCRIQGRMCLAKNQLKRRVQEIGNEVEEEEEEEEEETVTRRQFVNRIPRPDDHLYDLLRINAGKIYQKAFEVGSSSEFKMYYTPPSITTLSAFKTLLVDQYPKLEEQAGLQPAEQVALPEEVLKSEEFNLLASRFKSLFSWPLIMGETPV